MQNSNNDLIQPQIQFADFRERFIAYIIDSFLVGYAFVFLLKVDFGDKASSVFITNKAVLQAILVLLYMAYHGFFLSSSLQATPGKWFMGLYVVNKDGSKLGFFKGLFRNSVGYMLSKIIFCFGFLWLHSQKGKPLCTI